MTDAIKYSMIIPVYNAEKTLARCLESVLTRQNTEDLAQQNTDDLTRQNTEGLIRQSTDGLTRQRSDVEIIIINDGSTDGSERIISDYLKIYNNIVYIRQENAGVSRARNAGLSNASGDYITFLDSDDYLEPGYFSELDRMGEKEDSDLIVFAHRIHGEPASRDEKRYEMIEQAGSTEKKREMLLAGREIMPPWNKRFKRSIIEKCGLRFPETLQIGEDFNFCLAYAVQCTSISVDSKSIYVEDVSDNHSLSRKYRPHLDAQIISGFCFAADTIRESGVRPTDKEKLLAIADYLFIKNVFTCITEEFKIRKPQYRRDRDKIKEICENFSDPISSRSVNRIHRMLKGFLRRKRYFIFYAVSVLVKGRVYRDFSEEQAA